MQFLSKMGFGQKNFFDTVSVASWNPHTQPVLCAPIEKTTARKRGVGVSLLKPNPSIYLESRETVYEKTHTKNTLSTIFVVAWSMRISPSPQKNGYCPKKNWGHKKVPLGIQKRFLTLCWGKKQRRLEKKKLRLDRVKSGRWGKNSGCKIKTFKYG